MKKPYKLSFITTDETYGIPMVVPNLSSLCRIEVSDFSGNQTMISIPVEYDSLPAIIQPEPIASNYFVKSDIDSNFAKDNMSVFFPAGTFYDDFELNFDVKNDTLFLHEDTVPAHTNFTISIEDSKYTEEQRQKMFIGRIQGKNISYNSTFRKDSIFSAKVKILGKYALVLDAIPPTITISNPIEGKWLSNEKSIQLQ